MLARIRTFQVRTRSDLQWFMDNRDEWYPLNKVNPVLGCVTLHPLSTPDKPRLSVSFYQRCDGGQLGPTGRKRA